MQKGFGLIGILIVVGIIAILGIGVFKIQLPIKDKFIPTTEETSAIDMAEQMKDVMEEKNNGMMADADDETNTKPLETSNSKQPTEPQDQSSNKIVWRSFSSSEALKPVASVEGDLLLSTLQTGDESGIRTDIQIHPNADLLMFDMNFLEPGDGDWLTISFEDTLLFTFRGDVSSRNEYLPVEVPIAHIRAKVGVLEFKLHGYGSVTKNGISIVNLKNIAIIKD
ncbi:MAG: hypothetical protein A3J55_00715 [Candidatus Ryanbacteria bacterium RIFCSPHIGHO2_02_FULL_45_17b]|uniref:Uncharacterized protein n=1 Tax=Candidatus Ryanbacteria bacterium RIFCSPHIGHO2_01_FULL_45_22 TaxID=1802114 RepID=A0A1G2G1Y5_9BACT|nr:MAG: hypothetical protein A2719_03180 [Candidatus Ryanbacteria bacterium RIFCSPHIGHO2_01_FULL_45_22]OGZ47065.1 MAG: hypothetical protein A3J55_00715 [Candidatus Ryanbacteria bacterium RIFCSPHIGHO2_02_FULL_45_17b]